MGPTPTLELVSAPELRGLTAAPEYWVNAAGFDTVALVRPEYFWPRTAWCEELPESKAPKASTTVPRAIPSTVLEMESLKGLVAMLPATMPTAFGAPLALWHEKQN